MTHGKGDRDIHMFFFLMEAIRWSLWGPEQFEVAKESLRSQIQWLRIHPSVLVFLYGSDESPPTNVEQMYLDVFAEELWPNPTLASAADTSSPLTGSTGEPLPLSSFLFLSLLSSFLSVFTSSFSLRHSLCTAFCIPKAPSLSLTLASFRRGEDVRSV